MGRTNLDRTRIAELKKKIELCENNKQQLINFLQKLVEHYKRREISYYEYQKIISEKRNGRTIQEWLEHYDDYIKDCEERINREHKSEVGKKVFTTFLFLFIISIVFFSSFYLRPAIIGLIVRGDTNEFTQQINLQFKESTDYEWQLENLGQLDSIKLSGLIKGEGQVKIYLNDLLILDSDNIKTTSKITGNIVNSIIGITGKAVEGEESVAPSEQSSSQETQSSSEETQNPIQTTEEAPQTQEVSPSQEESLPSETPTETPTEPTQEIPTETPQEQPSENITETPQEIPEEMPAEIEITIKEFLDACKETCNNLRNLNLNSSSYTLKIEITNAELSLKEIKYEILKQAEKIKEEIPENITSIENITAENITLIENITAENITLENITEINATISTTQFQARLGEPVKWKKNITLDRPGLVKIKLPKEAENITVNKIEAENIAINKILEAPAEQPSENIIETQEKIEETAKEIQAQEEAKSTEKSTEEQLKEVEKKLEELKKEIAELEKIIGETKTESAPAESSESPATETSPETGQKAIGITGMVNIEIKTKETQEKFSLRNFFKNFFKGITGAITGRAITTEEIPEEAVEVTINDTALEYEITYETPAPYLIEENISTGKKLTIVGPETLHYENVSAFINLQKEVPKKAIKLYHLVNETKEPVEFTAYDLNNNSLIDYIEWQVESLSNQTYEISITILNVHSYPSLYENWTVEFETSGTADLKITATSDINYTSETTRWTDYSEDENLYDLKFLKIKCRNETKQYEWQGENCNENECSVFIANYSCNDTAYEISKVLTPEKHVLKFSFGSQEAYAYNQLALIIGNVTTLCGEINSYSTVYINNSGTLKICKNTGAGTGYVNISLGKYGNFTMLAGGNISGGGVGVYGGAGASGSGTKQGFQGTEGNTSVAGVASNKSNLGGGGGGWRNNTGNGAGGGGGAFGGAGGNGSRDEVNSRAGEGGKIYNNDSDIKLVMGSGGGGCAGDISASGGNASGGIKINASSGIINIAGFVNLTGNPGDDDTASTDAGAGGGGSGGHLILIANNLILDSAKINLAGGRGGNTNAAGSDNCGGGGGGGGRMVLIHGTFSNTSAVITVSGGAAGASGGCAGVAGAQGGAGIASNWSITFPAADLSIYVNITGPLNNTNISTNQIAVNYTIPETNIDTCWYSNDTYTKNTTLTGCANITGITWSQGQHNVTVYANDTWENKNSSSISFFIDTIAPLINITGPFNSTNFSTSSVLVNYTINDSGTGFKSCLWSNNFGATNNSLTCGTNITGQTWDEGLNTIFVYANDSSGNINNSQSTTFRVDTSPPYFNEPITNQTITARNSFEYDTNATDAGVGVFVYAVNDSTNFQINTTGSIKNKTGLSLGIYWINISLNDTLNNKNSTIFFVNVTDLIAPFLNVTNPLNSTNFTTTNTEVNYTVSDETGLSVCEWSKDFGATNNSLTCGTNVTGQTWDEGLNTIFVYANDTANNKNSSSVTFRVDTTPPALNITSPFNSTNFSTSSVLINYTLSDAGVGLQSCEWSKDFGATNNSLTCGTNITGQTWDEGLNTIFVYANDTLGFINTSQSITFRVDTRPPYFDEPITNQTINIGNSFEYDTNATDVGVGVFVYAVNDSTFSINTTGSIKNASALASSTIYWLNVSLNDTLNNKNSTIFFVNVTEVQNKAPVIKQVMNESLDNIVLTEGPYHTNVSINFTVYDENGFTDLLGSVQVIINRSNEGTRINGSGTVDCMNIVNYSTNYANFSCFVNMWWWDADGTWTVNVSVRDSTDLATESTNTSISFASTTGFLMAPAKLTWLEIFPGNTNKTANEYILLNNTGNQPISATNIQINATDLVGETDNSKHLYVGNFSIGPHWTSGDVYECDSNLATTMVNDTFTGIAIANLTKGNYTENNNVTGQEQLFVCLRYAGSELTSQAYSTLKTGSWIVKILFVSITIRKRKKKQKSKNKIELIKDDKLMQALSLITDELKQEYSLNKQQIIGIVTEKLKEKYKISKKELIRAIKEKGELNIPLSVFSKKLGCLEALVKYMKENLNMSYREISKLLNRNERTIWTAYNKAKIKQPESFEIKETSMFIPISVFNNRKFTILESIIIYLKAKGLKHVEIARLLDRDQRNIWTIYSRAVRKIKRKV